MIAWNDCVSVVEQRMIRFQGSLHIYLIKDGYLG